jgi:hypothetical protein
MAQSHALFSVDVQYYRKISIKFCISIPHYAGTNTEEVSVGRQGGYLRGGDFRCQTCKGMPVISMLISLTVGTRGLEQSMRLMREKSTTFSSDSGMTSKCEGSNTRICAFVLLGNALLSSSFTGDKVPETDRN